MEAAIDEEIVVYLRGLSYLGDTWHRVVLDTNNPVVSKGKKRKGEEGKTICEKDLGERETPKISPVAVIPEDYGFVGGWTVIDDDIYWVGGCRDVRCNREVFLYKDLIKHNINHPVPNYWDTVCSLTIPRGSPFLAAVDRKIAVFAGVDHRINPKSESDDNDWKKCGEIYDLDAHSLSYLSSDINLFDPYYVATTVVEDPKQLVFYSLSNGSMLILDASTGDTVENYNFFPDKHSTSFFQEVSPQLIVAARNSYAVFHKRTFYWFTDELRLYGYDIDLHKWFRSECLEQQLSPVQVNPLHKPPLYPFLVFLPNGNFLMIICQERLHTMASFSVTKDVPNLILAVNVKHIQHFLADDPFFRPYQGKAIRLKKAGPGTTRG